MAQQINEITKIPSNSEVIKILNQIIKRYNSLGDLYQYKGSVQTYDDLLAIQNPAIGDVYNVVQEDPEEGVAAGSNFAWNGTEWDNLGMSLDGLVKKINGFAPDDLGAVVFQYIKNITDNDGTLTITIRNGESESTITIDTGKVKTVNGEEPDEQGNIQIVTNEGVWQANEEVEAGDMRYLAGRDNTGYLLEYVGAGTTGQTQPVVPELTEVANYSAVDRVGKMRMIFNLAEKDVDEILAAGVLYNRATYSELWNYVQLKPSLLISEAEWQAKYAQTGGKFVPFYSSGDGTTTFRTPLLSAYPCGVNNSNNVGEYASDGLPNIEGTWEWNGLTDNNYTGATTGAFGYYQAENQANNADGFSSGHPYGISFNASNSNEIYGAVDEVRPKTMYGIWVIKAVGVIVDSIGSTDIQSILNGIQQMQVQITALQNQVSDTNNFTIIYPNGGTEESPANITLKDCFVENNPFPGYYVYCEAQISDGTRWAGTGFTNEGSASQTGGGVIAEQLLPDDKIYVMAGRGYLSTSNGYTEYNGSPLAEFLTSDLRTAPCRVLVYKLGKIESGE